MHVLKLPPIRMLYFLCCLSFLLPGCGSSTPDFEQYENLQSETGDISNLTPSRRALFTEIQDKCHDDQSHECFRQFSEEQISEIGTTLEAACGVGNGWACGLMSEYVTSNGYGDENIFVSKTRFAELGCELNDPKSCDVFGRALDSGRYAKEDPRKARSLLEKSCGQGYARSCSRIGYCYRNGDCLRLNKNDKAAFIYFEHACEIGNDDLGCENMMLMLSVGQGTKIDAPRSANYFKESCDNDSNMQFCYTLALMHFNGAKDFPKNHMEAAKYMKKSCDQEHQHLPSCYFLGRMYERGDGVEKDIARAAELYTRICNSFGGDARACMDAGYLYETGEGVERDLTKAADLYRTACVSTYFDARIPEGCDHNDRIRESLRR